MSACLRLLAVLAVSAALVPSVRSAPHEIVLEGPVAHVEEGLLLGNGDLSCSVFQTADEIVFRFGKGDVWDRRLELDGIAAPTTLGEYRRGVLDEGWTCKVNGADAAAAKGTKDERRMREVLSGWSVALGRSPYPCPKPAGELRMRIPSDLPGPADVRQRVVVEEGRYEISLGWRNGVRLAVEAVVAPVRNVFSLRWDVSGWNELTRVGVRRAPVGFVLLRRADPFYDRYIAERDILGGESKSYTEDRKKTLPQPTVVMDGSGRACGVEQAFYPDALFPEGFRHRMTLFADGLESHPIFRRKPEVPVSVRFSPRPDAVSGELQVAVTTSRDGRLEAGVPARHGRLRAEAAEAARRHWERSALAVPGDQFLENLWYATYHARRCVLRGGTVPPGLFLPSTVGEYSPWHGDYHSNYNVQSIYWGDLTANRLSEAEAYFDTMDFFVPLGRRIARDYYGCRGCFIQLQGFPLLAPDDYNGGVALGRMAYMTGWAMTRYWEFYQYVRDRDWLAKRGYPFIRDAALFYLDFLLKAPHPDLPPGLRDGKYHAFPSVDSEDGLTGDPMHVTDRPDTMRFIRHALFAAIEASRTLGTDADLRARWQERLDNLAGQPAGLSPYERHCLLSAPPEFGDARPYRAPVRWSGGTPEKPMDDSSYYYGMQTRHRLGRLRRNAYDPATSWPEYRATLERWTHPNGLVWGMAIAHLGRVGAWTESLSCMAPYQEMMLQSWDGAIRLFPWWPRNLDAAFRNWRAQGAFLVSAGFKGGRVVKATVRSERGEDCRVHGNWLVTDASGAAVRTDRDEFGRLRFGTVAGETYTLKETK